MFRRDYNSSFSSLSINLEPRGDFASIDRELLSARQCIVGQGVRVTHVRAMEGRLRCSYFEGLSRGFSHKRLWARGAVIADEFE